MAKKFVQAERHLISLFKQGEVIQTGNKFYKIEFAGKPRSKGNNGEPKTDVYVCLSGIEDDKLYELKLSYKKSNADFLENKMKPERAEQIFGEGWKKIICNSTSTLYEKFINRQLIYKKDYGHTKKGSITLGWRFELLNKEGGELSGKIHMTSDQIIEVYSGNKLMSEKKDALVDNVKVKNSGVATSILTGDINENESLQDVISRVIPIKEYIEKNPDVYMVCKALNYNTYSKKLEGNRNLAVYINWVIKEGKLTPEFELSNPLEVTGLDVLYKLEKCMEKLKIKNTDDISTSNSYIQY